MFFAILLSFFGTSDDQCITNVLIQDKFLSNASSTIEINCMSSRDEAAKKLIIDSILILHFCNERNSYYKKDTSSSPYNALVNVVEKCRIPFYLPENIKKRQDMEKAYEERQKKEKVEREKRIKFFKANKQKLIGIATKCLKENANDPSSVKVSDMALTKNEDEYITRFRAKNGFGALILQNALVTIENGKCTDVSSNTDEE